MRELEASILRELQEVTKNKKLRQKNIQEWSTTHVEAQSDEKLAFLPKMQIHVAYKA